MLESIALGMLLEKDLTGYDIKKFIENGIGVFYKASFGSLYPALKRLTEKGYLTTRDKPQGSRKKIFLPHNRGGTETIFSTGSPPPWIFLKAPIPIWQRFTSSTIWMLKFAVSSYWNMRSITEII